MIESTSSDEKLAKSVSAASRSGFGFIVALVVLLAIMVGSIYYPYPSGKNLDFWGFVALWARELIAVGLLVVTVVALAITWLFRRIKGKREDNENAL